jgi:formylglycine-generating enzyme required for sulfatase activity
MAATRFMRELEIDLVPDRNVAAVDLFDPRHARKVLGAYGRAYEALPAGGELTRDQEAFLDQAIAGLAQDGLIVPVRLALFAEMVKTKPWTLATLREVGGMDGVGVKFLEETFSARSNPNHRYRQRAAQAVLKALLPETKADIKGRMRSIEELRGISGYGDRPDDFADLIRMLDTELRLITPVDPAGSIDEDLPAPPAGDRYYQLTHDYLVHSLRDWLTRKQRETRRGRADLLLEERSRVWGAEPQRRHLPSAWEWLKIRLWTGRKDWTETQRRMMSRGGRVHGMRLLGLCALLALTAGGMVAYNVYSRTQELLLDLAKFPVDRKPQVLDQLARYPRWVYLRRLRDLAWRPGNDPGSQLGYSLALLSDDPGQLAYLYRRLLDSNPAELKVLRDRLLPVVQRVSPAILDDLRNVVHFQDGEQSETDEVQNHRAERRARAAAALVRLGQADDEVWRLLEHSPDPRSRSAFIHALNTLGADPAILASELNRLTQTPETDTPRVESSREKNAYFFDSRTSKMRALIQALAGYSTEALERLGPHGHAALIATLTELYRDDPDAGVHSAAELALRRWGHQDRMAIAPGRAPRAGEPIRRRWYVNSEGQTMVLIDGPVTFDMGSPPSEPDRVEWERLHRRIIPRRFAIASTEVTVEQFQRYAKENRGSPHEFKQKYSPEPDGPMIGVTWFDGAAYCNWLSDKEGLPRCYEPNQDGKYAEGVRVNAEAIARGGYRLPTEAEWEYACRAGTITSRYYGSSLDLFGLYEWYVGTSGYRARPCGWLLPNDLGLFDMLGNVCEWCHDRWADYEPGPSGEICDVIGKEQITAERRILRCGSFTMVPTQLRSAARTWMPPGEVYAEFDLRPTRTVP